MLPLGRHAVDKLDTHPEFESIEPAWPFNEGEVMNRVNYWPTTFLSKKSRTLMASTGDLIRQPKPGYHPPMAAPAGAPGRPPAAGGAPER